MGGENQAAGIHIASVRIGPYPACGHLPYNGFCAWCYLCSMSNFTKWASGNGPSEMGGGKVCRSGETGSRAKWPGFRSQLFNGMYPPANYSIFLACFPLSFKLGIIGFCKD